MNDRPGSSRSFKSERLDLALLASFLIFFPFAFNSQLWKETAHDCIMKKEIFKERERYKICTRDRGFVLIYLIISAQTLRISVFVLFTRYKTRRTFYWASGEYVKSARSVTCMDAPYANSSRIVNLSRGIKTRNVFHLREKGIARAVDALSNSRAHRCQKVTSPRFRSLEMLS